MESSVRSVTEERAFAPVGGAPLAGGSVERLPAASSRIFARERYLLEGAVAGAELEVRLLVHLFDPTCSNVPVPFASTPLRTDGSGDGTAELVVRTEDVPPAVRRQRHGVRWEIRSGGTVLYRTDCAPLAID